MGERPGGVAVLAILVMIFSILEIIGGIIMIFVPVTSGGLIPWMITTTYPFVIPGIVFVIIGTFWLIVGIGLWKLWSWARILAIIFGILGIIGSIFLIIIGFAEIILLLVGVIELLISLIVVIYLLQGSVAEYFT